MIKEIVLVTFIVCVCGQIKTPPLSMRRLPSRLTSSRIGSMGSLARGSTSLAEAAQRVPSLSRRLSPSFVQGSQRSSPSLGEGSQRSRGSPLKGSQRSSSLSLRSERVSNQRVLVN